MSEPAPPEVNDDACESGKCLTIVGAGQARPAPASTTSGPSWGGL